MITVDYWFTLKKEKKTKYNSIVRRRSYHLCKAVQLNYSNATHIQEMIYCAIRDGKKAYFFHTRSLLKWKQNKKKQHAHMYTYIEKINMAFVFLSFYAMIWWHPLTCINMLCIHRLIFFAVKECGLFQCFVCNTERKWWCWWWWWLVREPK